MKTAIDLLTTELHRLQYNARQYRMTGQRGEQARYARMAREVAEAIEALRKHKEDAK